LILVPVIFFAVYYLFAMGRIVDRIVNTDAPAAKLAEQASIEMLEARRATRNYALFQDPEYLEANRKALANVRQILLSIGNLEPDDLPIAQKGLEAVTEYQRRFATAVSMGAKARQEPADRIRQAVLAHEKDVDDLVREAKHERRAQLIQDLRTRVVSFDSRITEATQIGSPALGHLSPDLQESSGQILEIVSDLEKRNWGRVRLDHEKARQLIHRAEWSLSIVSAITLAFSVWASFILPRQVIQPLVSLKEAVDHAATGNYEVEFELLGGGEVVELARSVQNLISELRKNP
jgi:CHASE3 domain sensor protein